MAGFASREEILSGSDVVVLPKPQHEDVAMMGPGQILWGWPHCVQDPVMTQLAIDRRLTLIAFEVMNHWTVDGAVGLHVFHKNNELAGYCSVLHALELIGSTGDYGRRLRAVVIGFGATARGAVTALNAHGIRIEGRQMFDHDRDRTFELKLSGPSRQFDIATAALLAREDVFGVHLD